MTLEELDKKLKELNISEDRYYLHGLYGSANDDNKLGLTIKKGKYTLDYEIYFKERGEKNIIRNFSTEDEACRYMLKRLKENKEIEDKYSK